MKITINQLKQMIKEQIGEASAAEKEMARREREGLRDPAYKAEQEQNRQKSLEWKKEHDVEVGPSIEASIEDMLAELIRLASYAFHDGGSQSRGDKQKAIKVLKNKIIAKFGK